MSDLQCACTVLVARPGTPDLLRGVRGRNLAAVYASAAPPAVETAQTVAAGLGVAVTTRSELSELASGDGTAEPAGSYPFVEVLQEIADLHRGETVLVVGDTEVMAVEVRIDADAWVWNQWLSEG